MMLIIGASCEELKALTHEEHRLVDITEDIEETACAITYKDCWIVDDEGMEWYKGNCVHDKFQNDLSLYNIFDNIIKCFSSKLKLVAISSAPFTRGWGPKYLGNSLIKGFWISLINDLHNIEGICEEVVNALGDIYLISKLHYSPIYCSSFVREYLRNYKEDRYEIHEFKNGLVLKLKV